MTTYIYIYIAERYDIKSNVKLAGFQSQLEASCVSSHTDELRYNETVCLSMTIYMLAPSIEGINGF